MSKFLRSFTCLFLWLVVSGIYGDNYDPVALYLTWQHSPETTMTIQWLTDKNRIQDEVEFKSVQQTAWQKQTGTHHTLPDGFPYLLHRVELTHLTPGTEYIFRTGEDALSYKFMTMPKELDQPIRFVVGGDMYHDGVEFLEETNKQAAKTNPHFALVGGDIAYSGGKFSFYREDSQRWLVWLKAWKRDMITQDGRLIPMIVTLGNHDVNGRFGQTADQARFFYSFFLPNKREAFQSLDFGNYLSIIALDSGHTASIPGVQTKWLKNALSQRKDVLHKIAFYHVPAYPSVRSDQTTYCVSIRKNWVPLFEEYGLHIAFEHHDHAYKRTHPLRKGRIDVSGVTYIGDGSWGIERPRLPKKNRWYIAQSASARQFVLTTLQKNGRVVTSITSNGCILDQMEQRILNLIPAKS